MADRTPVRQLLDRVAIRGEVPDRRSLRRVALRQLGDDAPAGEVAELTTRMMRASERVAEPASRGQFAEARKIAAHHADLVAPPGSEQPHTPSSRVADVVDRMYR